MYVTTDSGWPDIVTTDASDPIVIEHLTMDSLTITSGTFDPNGIDFEITGDFTISNTGNIVVGNDAWNGVDVIVGGNLNLLGTVVNELNMRGTALWTLSVAGTRTVRYVDVSYCDSRFGNAIIAESSTDSGNTVNWTFAEYVVTGRTGLAISTSIAIGI